MSSLKRSSLSEPASRKKPRFDDDDDEEEEEEPARPTEVEGLPPTETTAHEDDRALAEDARALAEALLQACPPITYEDIQTIPDFNGKIIVQGDDKAEARRLFDESDEIKTLDKLDPGKHSLSFFKTFYKTFVRVFRSSPFILLSPLNNLRYRHRLSANTCRAAFGTTFSNHMAPLLVHPVWRQNHKLLRAALQFTILCRMQSRCPWPLNNDTLGYQALAKLRQTCQALDHTPIGIADMLRQAIDETPVAEEFPSFLVSIADHVKRGEEKDIEVGGQIVLPVELKDLTSIRAAIDSFQWRNASWRAGTRRIWDAFITERGGPQSEYPKDEELKDSIQASMRFLCQKIVIARSDTAEAGTIPGRLDPMADHEIEVEPTVIEDNEPESEEIDMYDHNIAERFDDRFDTLLKLVKNVDSNVSSLRTNNYGFEGLRAENERLQEEQLEASALEDSLRAEIAELKQSLAEAKAKSTTLEIDKTRQGDEIETLKSRTRTLESAVQELQASVKELQGISGVLRT
ncbi:hypothetical protein NW766_005781 [Fusarium irregulare]|uniref:Uncharacterized protein n=1 Tax=Fusarium irregulare TaxID=2494466 RepID=A0A9W8PT09_9HYPO|nr:hypothetical protein NW766_005781 [Fusarium irregulare]